MTPKRSLHEEAESVVQPRMTCRPALVKAKANDHSCSCMHILRPASFSLAILDFLLLMQVPQLGEAGLTIESGSISLSTYEIIATLLMIILSHSKLFGLKKCLVVFFFYIYF